MHATDNTSATEEFNLDAEAMKYPHLWHTFGTKLHDATRRHFDFRIESEGVLKSWALPIGPSRRAGLLREAIEMDDHDPANLMFEGIHRTGPMMLWDYGIWIPHPDCIDIGESLRQGNLRFRLYGRKLRGSWELKRTIRMTNGDRAIWTLCKRLDPFASSFSGSNFPPLQLTSALTGRTMEEIVHDWLHPVTGNDDQMNLFS